MTDSRTNSSVNTIVPGRNTILVALVLFALTRVPLLLTPVPTSDIFIYADIANFFSQAQNKNTTLYVERGAFIDKQIALARAKGQDDIVRELGQHKHVEYPPLALCAMILPQYFAGERQSTEPNTSFIARYRIAYRAQMLVVDTLIFILVVFASRKLFPDQKSTLLFERLAIYIFAGLLLWPVMYERLDLVMNLLVLASLVLLCVRAHYFWPLLFLAMAINFKVIPVVMTPIWIIGTLPLAALRQRKWKRLGLLVGGRCALLGLLIVAVFLPFYGLGGSATLDFLKYHSARGIEIGSLYSSLQMGLQVLGLNIEVYGSHGGVNIRSPIEPLLVTASSWCLGIMLLAVLGLFVVVISNRVRRGRVIRTQGDARGALGQLYPKTFLAFTAATMLIAIANSKVFSPQYLILLVPLITLLPFQLPHRRIIMWSFVITCFVTMIIFPFLFWPHITGLVNYQLRIFQGPTLLGALVLSVRNGLFLFLTIYVVIGAGWNGTRQDQKKSIKTLDAEIFQTASPPKAIAS